MLVKSTINLKSTGKSTATKKSLDPYVSVSRMRIRIEDEGGFFLHRCVFDRELEIAKKKEKEKKRLGTVNY